MKSYPSVILLCAALLVAACQAPPRRKAAGGAPHAAPVRSAGAPEGSTQHHQARAMAMTLAQLTGSIPSKTTRTLNGNGTTGSIACEFTGTNKPATKWWVGGPTPPSAAWQYNVMTYPATPTTGFNAGETVMVRFRTTVANVVVPSPTPVTVIANKTVVLIIKYQ